MKFIRRKMMSNMENAIYFFDLETTGLLKHNGRIIVIYSQEIFASLMQKENLTLL